jgi:hypothetical protein
MNADLLLNSFALSQESALLVSGKLMEYLATGNPVVGLGNPSGDAAELLRGMEHARIFDRRDVDEISTFIENIYFHWQNKKQFFPSGIGRFSRYETTRQLASLIQSII